MQEWYLGARGIKFWRHPGAHLSKKPGRWLIAAELVDTTRLYGRGLARSTRSGYPMLAGHLLKTQLLEPHWEKKAAEVVALQRATLYGIVVYANRRVNFGNVDPKAAREIFIRERWWKKTGTASCPSSPTTASCWPRWKSWSTRAAGRMCWSTTA
jgi:ATP-dependent helicase HrpA